ncbi:MAG: hypothetical protein HDT43_01900 [Ruminococcaceae bacterium]|nr:hypothetical protein [Oscillospiraceae bacterium]
MVREPKEKKIKVLSLGKLLLQAETQEDKQDIRDLLSSFSCSQDKDIEDFLHNRAIDFERINKARTYLVCDDNVLQAEGKLIILGYFSTALKVLDIPENISNRFRKRLDGMAAKLYGNAIKSIPCYLIGQLAKNSAIPDEQSINGSELIDCAISIIRSAETLVGGRYVLIECHDNPKLLKFYEDNDFKAFAEIPYKTVPMVQMLRPLCTTEL